MSARGFMGRLRWPLVAAMLLSVLAAPGAWASGFAAAASPSRFELEAKPGDVLSRTLDLQHIGSEGTEYVIRSADWVLTEEKGLEFQDALQPGSCRPWLRLERRSVRLDPRVRADLVAAVLGQVTADAALAFPDFRSAERTFQLLAQVAGRAGRRDLPGHVVIQSYQPEHPVLQHAKAHDFEGFFHEEIGARRELGYPPFGRLAALKLDGPDEEKLQEMSRRIDSFLRALPDVVSGKVKVLGPAPSPIERLRGR